MGLVSRNVFAQEEIIFLLCAVHYVQCTYIYLIVLGGSGGTKIINTIIETDRVGLLAAYVRTPKIL